MQLPRLSFVSEVDACPERHPDSWSPRQRGPPRGQRGFGSSAEYGIELFQSPRRQRPGREKNSPRPGGGSPRPMLEPVSPRENASALNKEVRARTNGWPGLLMVLSEAPSPSVARSSLAHHLASHTVAGPRCAAEARLLPPHALAAGEGSLLLIRVQHFGARRLVGTRHAGWG